MRRIDKVKEMSPEELAKLLTNDGEYSLCRLCIRDTRKCYNPAWDFDKKQCIEGVTKWFEQDDEG